MVHDMPQLNGVAECLNCTLVDHIHTFTHLSSLSKFLQGEALQHPTWLKNHSALQALNRLTPYQMLLGCAPDLSYDVLDWGSDDKEYISSLL